MGMREFDSDGCVLADGVGLGKTIQSTTISWAHGKGQACRAEGGRGVPNLCGQELKVGVRGRPSGSRWGEDRRKVHRTRAGFTSCLHA